MNLLEAKEVISRHQQDAPILIVPLARDLGFEVYRVKNWTDNLSGMIKRDKRGGASGYAIFVNADHSQTRRRFTIAHEVAHGLLHNHLIGDGIEEDALYRSGLSNAVEAQANRYAADLLMPWSLLNAYIARGLKTVPKLAQRFLVSRSAMSIRLGIPDESPLNF